MQKKSGLSKKQQKKLKQQQKQQAVQNQQKQPLNTPIQAPNKKLKPSTDKPQNPPKPQQPQSAQQQQQQLQQNNGDIDFNQQLQDDQQAQVIDVTFLIAEIREQYYHSMKTILLRYGQILGMTESEIAGEVLEKGSQGNVIVAEDDEEGDDQEQDEEEQKEEQNDQLNAYSVITFLPSNASVTEKSRKLALSSLEKHKSVKNYSQAHKILSAPKSIYLLLSARLPNLPSFVVVNSHQVFVQDLKLLKTSNPKHPILQNQYLLNISEVEVTNPQLINQLDELIFAKFQDYEFCQKSVCWWVGQNVKSQRGKADLRRLYFIIKKEQYFKATDNLKNYLEDNDA